jgi:Uma2 family endonuclease
MAMLVTDTDVEDRIKAERAESGADRFDDVWDGVYHVSPLAGDEHQQIVIRLAGILLGLIEWPGHGEVRAGVNVSDREEDWAHNYRIPDVAVFLLGGRARNCGTHWLGGPDFLVEVLSPGDDSRAKLPFYAQLGAREVLLVDRDPWAVELHRLQGGRLVPAGTSRLAGSQPITSALVPLSFRLVAGAKRPAIEVVHADGAQRWLV